MGRGEGKTIASSGLEKWVVEIEMQVIDNPYSAAIIVEVLVRQIRTLNMT